jgi:putative hydrolase of the HAD superfamily
MAVTRLPRAMLIDMDDTILSAYGRPEIAWNHVAAEFADELAPLPPPAVAAAVLGFARNFWSTAEPAWRLKLGEARRVTVQGGFDALAAAGHARLPADLATRIADRFSEYREEEMFIFPGAHDAIDELRALGVKLALVTNGAAMEALGVGAADTWMIGDNLEWEVEAPQRLGIYAIWMDVHGDGLPPGSTVRPDRIIRSLAELLPK